MRPRSENIGLKIRLKPKLYENVKKSAEKNQLSVNAEFSRLVELAFAKRELDSVGDRLKYIIAMLENIEKQVGINPSDCFDYLDRVVPIRAADVPAGSDKSQ